MNPEQILLALKARYKIVVVAVVLTLAVALGTTFMASKIYTANAAVVIDVKFADPIVGSVLSAWTQPSYIPTQLDIISSDRVAVNVVRMLKLDQKPGVAEAWKEQTGGKGDLDTWLAGQIKGNMDAKPAKDSNVITISVKDRDPRQAAQLANAFAQAYIDASVDLRREPARQYEKYFVAQAQAARDRLEKAQTALSTFQQTNRIIVGTDDRYDIETNRLSQLSTQLAETQALQADSQSREKQARANSGSISEVLQSPLVQGLKADVAREEAKLREMSATMGVNNPQLQRQEALVASLRQRLGAETQQLANGVATSNRINAARVSDLSAALEAQKARVLKLKEDRDSAAVLQRDVDSAKAAYDAVVGRVTQSNLESQANTTNIAILNPAVEPTRASSPKVAVNMALALVLGLMLGIAAALLLEQKDRRIRSIDDLGRVLGLPVMGVIGTKRGVLDYRRTERLAGPRGDPLGLPHPGAA